MYAPTPSQRQSELWNKVEAACQPPFQIQVKGITGSTTCVMIFGSDKVEEVARQVAEATSLPAKNIRLQWRRHVLEAQRTIRSYGIHKDAVIFASLRMRGGEREAHRNGTPDA